MRKNNKRDSILDAALLVVDEKGARHLTIDAVAARSGVSKGGVLYHFQSKQALLSGMLQHLVDTIRYQMDDAREAELDITPLMAILKAREDMSPTERRASQALLAVAAEDTDLLAPARQQFAAVFREALKETDNTMAATVLLLANEGLRFLEILDVSPLTEEDTAEVVSYMHAQAEQL